MENSLYYDAIYDFSVLLRTYPAKINRIRGHTENVFELLSNRESLTLRGCMEWTISQQKNSFVILHLAL